MSVDFSLLGLLSSRICHDLIGPAGSLSFAMSILKEDGIDNAEALDISMESVNNLINRIAFFRSAIGASTLGSDESALQKAKELTLNLISEKNIKIAWGSDIDAVLAKYGHSDNFKLLMNVFFIIFHAVQREANIHLYVKDIKNKLGIAISTTGKGLNLGADNIDALHLNIQQEELTARNVHSYFTAKLAQNLEADLEVNNNSKEELKIAFFLKKR